MSGRRINPPTTNRVPGRAKLLLSHERENGVIRGATLHSSHGVDPDPREFEKYPDVLAQLGERLALTG